MKLVWAILLFLVVLYFIKLRNPCGNLVCKCAK